MKCRAYIEPETKIALAGSALEAALKNPDSPRCGYELRKDDLFCPSCGATVEISLNDKDIKRATRSTFWVSMMPLILIKLVLFVLADIMDDSPACLMFLRILGWVELLAYMYFIKISVRRLHDIDRSGWWIAPSLSLMIISSILNGVAVGCESDSVVSEVVFSWVTTIAVVFSWVAIIANLSMIVWLGSVKGTKGPNKFGPELLATT